MLENIRIEGARVHNLKNVSLTLPRNKLIVFTGMSGSGKSSLAFDTIYAEGQRRYMESLSAYARQFLDQLDKPDVDVLEGLSPAISIDQKNASHNPRSTVGTITEIYDYLRLLFSSIGTPHCPTCQREVQSMSLQEMMTVIFQKALDSDVVIKSPLVEEKKGEFKSLFESLVKEGFVRAEVNGERVRLADDIVLDKHKKHTIHLLVDRMQVTEENRSRLFQSIETAAKQSNGLVLIEDTTHDTPFLFSEHLSCPHCETSLSEVSPRLFSFNSPVGACRACNGLGELMDFDPDLVIEHPDKPVKRCTSKVLNLDGTNYGKSLNRTAKQYDFDWSTPYADLSQKQKNVVLYGQEKAIEQNPYIAGEAEDYEGMWGDWEGVITNLRRRYFQTRSEGMRFFFRHYMTAKTCIRCEGTRVNQVARAVTVADKSLAELVKLPVQELLHFFQTLKLTPKQETIIKQVMKEIVERLGFLCEVGLTYLSLDRKAGTLSGGEFQRIRLSTQIGSGLTGVLYVLDEPSIGLHQRDNQRLIQTLKRLRDLGNTVIVVEHDEETIKEADYIVDIGPAAGTDGGNIVFAGTLDEFLKDKNSVTAQFVNGSRCIEVPKKRRKPKKDQKIVIKGASEHNLKNVTATFPLGQLICVTGVSGSGKSTLIYEIFHKAVKRHFNLGKVRPGAHKSIEGLDHIDKLITIDQSPIGRTPRSNPATYTGVFSPIRDLFTQTREAKVRGYKAGRFSFNVKGGRCEACEGDGVTKIEMHFLSDVYVMCDVCKGKRYNQETLEVTYKGYSINDVLSMTINKAAALFENIPAIYNKLKTIQDVGLGYVKLGQNATTLSGGEAQRIKLAKELSKRSTGKTLYLLDEPTTGLHFSDIEQLLTVINRLVDSGNTVVVIEHNLDVIKTADYILDMGPEGGDKGGKLIASGTPEQVSKKSVSHTGNYLSLLV